MQDSTAILYSAYDSPYGSSGVPWQTVTICDIAGKIIAMSGHIHSTDYEHIAKYL
jgi:hypothetical protein